MLCFLFQKSVTQTTLNFYIQQDVMFLISVTKLVYLHVHVVIVGGCYKGWPLCLRLTKLPSLSYRHECTCSLKLSYCSQEMNHTV